jgi:PAS domain-containing protein
MFTGTGSEEIAVEAMRAGLSDYVLKGNKHYVRLAASARAVMEKRRSQQKAVEIQHRLDGLLDRLNVGVFRATMDGLIVQANPAFLLLLGCRELPADAHLQELYFRSELYTEHIRDL